MLDPFVLPQIKGFRGSEAASLDGTDEAPFLLVNSVDVSPETGFP